MDKTKKRNIGIICAIVIGVLMIVAIIRFVLIFGLAISIPLLSKEEVYNDINKYNDYIGTSAKKDYKSKWEMSEEIFPKKIKDSYEVKDFTFVYYNPWDANYLAYLEIDYNEEDYEKEIERLNRIGISKYKGYYGVTGFDNYTLLAMDADSYHGFVYAITDDNNKIVYVEMIFCNYSMDIDYNKYIPKKYLPDGYDATMDNPYQKEKDKEEGIGNLF